MDISSELFGIIFMIIFLLVMFSWLILIILSSISIVRSDKKFEIKSLWFLAVLSFPYLGSLLWFISKNKYWCLMSWSLTIKKEESIIRLLWFFLGGSNDEVGDGCGCCFFILFLLFLACLLIGGFMLNALK